MVLSRSGVSGLPVLAVALLLAMVILACGGGKPDPAERWAELGLEEAEFVFTDGVTPDEQEAMKRALRAAQVVFAEHFGAVTSDVTVYILDADQYEERVVSALGEGHGFELTCGVAVPGEALIVAPTDCPEEKSRGAFLAHEYFRVLQQDAGGLAWRRQVGTVRQGVWLGWIEAGSAVYASALVSDATGRVSLDAQRDRARSTWANLAQPFPRRPTDLADREQMPLFVYNAGFLATDWLVERAGPEAVLKFFRFGGHAAAFEAAFGLTFDEFHIAFEEHRLEVAPPFE